MESCFEMRQLVDRVGRRRMGAAAWLCFAVLLAVLMATGALAAPVATPSAAASAVSSALNSGNGISDEASSLLAEATSLLQTVESTRVSSAALQSQEQLMATQQLMQQQAKQHQRRMKAARMRNLYGAASNHPSDVMLQAQMAVMGGVGAANAAASDDPLPLAPASQNGYGFRVQPADVQAKLRRLKKAKHVDDVTRFARISPHVGRHPARNAAALARSNQWHNLEAEVKSRPARRIPHKANKVFHFSAHSKPKHSVFVARDEIEKMRRVDNANPFAFLEQGNLAPQPPAQQQQQQQAAPAPTPAPAQMNPALSPASSPAMLALREVMGAAPAPARSAVNRAMAVSEDSDRSSSALAPEVSAVDTSLLEIAAVPSSELQTQPSMADEEAHGDAPSLMAAEFAAPRAVPSRNFARMFKTIMQSSRRNRQRRQ